MTRTVSRRLLASPAALRGRGVSGVGDAFRRLAGSTSGPVFIVLVVVFIACLIAVTIDDGGTGQFLSVDNIREMFVRSVALGIVAAGQTLVILGASLDLSVGWVVGLGSILAAETMPSATERWSMFTTLETVKKSPPRIVTTIQASTKTASSAP